MKHKLISLSFVLYGLLTIVLQELIPIAGGSTSLIFVLSIPVLAAMGIICAVMYYFFISKFQTNFYRSTLLFFMHALLIGLAFVFFPYQ